MYIIKLLKNLKINGLSEIQTVCKIVLKSKNYGKIKILPEVKLKQTAKVGWAELDELLNLIRSIYNEFLDFMSVIVINPSIQQTSFFRKAIHVKSLTNI